MNINSKIEMLSEENKNKFYAVVRDLIDSREYEKMTHSKSITEIHKEVYSNMFNK